ncbi:MAG: hypothetical protein ABIA04_00785 [Pseudomonadota bacterium]
MRHLFLFFIMINLFSYLYAGENLDFPLLGMNVKCVQSTGSTDTDSFVTYEDQVITSETSSTMMQRSFSFDDSYFVLSLNKSGQILSGADNSFLGFSYYLTLSRVYNEFSLDEPKVKGKTTALVNFIVNKDGSIRGHYHESFDIPSDPLSTYRDGVAPYIGFRYFVKQSAVNWQEIILSCSLENVSVY